MTQKNMSAKQTEQPGRTTRSSKWLVLATTSVGTLMSALNASIVNIANPVMASYFTVSMAQIQWVATIYLIVTCSLMLLFGSMGDRVGSHKVYIVGIAIFTLGSLFCALSPNLQCLVGARVLQGVGGALLVPVGRLTVLKAYAHAISERYRFYSYGDCCLIV